jgi:hypothetical protein
MRAIREQPRLTFARTIGAVCLIAAGIAIGAVVRGDNRDATRAAEIRLVSVQRSASDQRTELQRVTAQLTDAVTARNRSARALRTQRRVTQRLRRDLAAAKRKRHNTKSKARR